ncbi:MAG: hypothetical protein L0Z50_05375 [Verrucomicrobiales bacterium]|nr:hypothetical protein [Verrucomicrobiales bacterium]
MEGQLQPKIEQFIYSYINSLEQLEILLLLFESPDRSWTIEAVYDIIKSNPASISRRLETLTQQGLVVADPETKGGYRFQVSNPELTQTIQELSNAYTERRLRVIETVFSKPSSSIKSFADAFRIRKDQKDG